MAVKDLALDDIELLHNYRQTEPVSESDPDMIELAASIRKDGVWQAVLVRPHPTVAEKYELVFGNRRLFASRMAGRPTIPANIKAVSDEDILMVQITENLQRKDVHPMDEAIAFQSLRVDKGHTIEEIAARFVQKPEFVTMRLKLNDLIPELRKRFQKNAILLGHAMILCRLKAQDQQSVSSHNSTFGSVENLQDAVNRNILRRLSSAAFKQDDTTLDIKAGPCTTCPKRSGCNTLLFADIKENDRCFDKACFENKAEVFFVRQLQEIIETKPEIHLIQDGSPVKAVTTLLRQMNVKPLEDCQTYQSGRYNKKAKGFYLSGLNRGKIENIYVLGKAAAQVDKKTGLVKRTVSDIDIEVEGIKTRQNRALELDGEKVWTKAQELFKKPALLTRLQFANNIIVLEERNAMAYALVEGMEHDEYRKAAFKLLDFKSGGNGYYVLQLSHAKKMKPVTEDTLSHLLRLYMLSKLCGGLSADQSDGAFMLMPVLQLPQYLKPEMETVVADQKAESDKRIVRADKRLAALKLEKKELEAKDKPKPADKATVKKGSKSESDHGQKSAPRKNHLGQELTSYGLEVLPEHLPPTSEGNPELEEA
jgi:ParB/RepB/Spo0J family partition protein